MNSKRKMAYLISRYPAYSHTFIQREIEGLRLKGCQIFTASINKPDIPISELSSINREELNNTFYIKEQGWWRALYYCLVHFFTHPIAFFKGYFYALSLCQFDLKRILYHTFYFVEALLIGFWMRSKDIWHIHVHFANPASTVALIASKTFPLTFSMTVHGPDEFYDVTLNNLAEKVKWAQFVFCISNYTKSQVMRLSSPALWSKCHLCYLGVDLDKYFPKEVKEKNSSIEILCVGRLVPNKGQRILIEAFRLLIEEGRDIYLTLVGDGPDKKELEQLVRQNNLNSRISFKGALNSEALLSFYKKAHVFVLTSFAEGLPVVLMEAMAMEIPCVATAINGIPEIINNTINGLLVSPSDVLQTANSIKKIIDNKVLGKKMGEKARQTIIEKFDIKKNTELLSKLFTANSERGRNV